MAPARLTLPLLVLLLHACDEQQAPSDLQDADQLLTMETAARTSDYLCDNGSRVQSRYEPRQDELVLFMTDRAVRLQPVRSASGAKYAAEGIVFWTKGTTAVLQRAGQAQTQCRHRE